MPKIYSTAKGVQIDFDAFVAKNENTRAVGNMNVNARGDLLDSTNKKIQSKNQQIANQYRKQIGNMVADTPVYSSDRAAKRAEDIANEYSTPNKIKGLDEDVIMPKPKASVPNQPKTTADQDDTTADIKSDDNPQSTGGLANALAKARESKQEPLKTDREIEREKPGVKRV